MRLDWDLDTDKVTARAFEPLVPTGSSSVIGSISARYGGVLALEFCFNRQRTNDQALDIGESPGIGILVKRSSGANQFDDPPLLPSPTFTRSVETLTPVGTFTADAAGNFIALTSEHGKKDGQPVQVSSTGTLPANTAAGSVYYARDVGLTTMKLALTPGGAAIDIDAGSGTHTLHSCDAFVYRAELSMAEPILAKLLGVDNANVKEQIAIQCLGDTAGNLSGRYCDIYTSDVAFLRIWIDVNNAGPQPANGGGTLVEIDVATNAEASDVAAAIAAKAAITAVFNVSQLADTVTLTSKTIGFCGYHHPQSSGFTLTLLAAGASAFNQADQSSVTLELEPFHSAFGDTEIAEHIALIVKNSFQRTAQGSPSASGLNVRRGVHHITINTGFSGVAITFATPFPNADYFIDARIVNTTDAPPDNIFLGTVKARTPTGFTIGLSADVPTGNYDLEYRCELN